jgi:hypothetical protein
MNYTGIKQSDKVLLMKVTSRGRPEICKNTIERYKYLAANPDKMLWILSVDDNDPKIYEYCDIKGVILMTNPPSNKITAINSNVPETGWDILLNISDDQIPIVQGYDDIIRNTMPDDLDHSLWFNDGWQPRINTQEIIGYNYYKRFGYIYNPIYKSFYCDNESTIVAKKLGKLIQSPKCIIKHFHPGWDKNSHIKMDDLYRHNDQFFGSDGLIFKQREANGFT